MNDSGTDSAVNSAGLGLAMLRRALAGHGRLIPGDARAKALLESAVRQLRRTVPLLGDDRLHRTLRAHVYEALALAVSELGDSEAALSYLGAALDYVDPADEPIWWRRLQHNLGVAYQNRVVDDVANNRERAVAPSALSVTGEAMASLAAEALLNTRQTDDRVELERAVDLFRQALDAGPPDHPDRAKYLTFLSDALQIRFKRAGDLVDLKAAVAAGRDAVAATAPDDPDRAGYLSNLANALRLRFERTGNQVDLDEAVEVGREAVAADRAGPWLSNLGAALRIRFERTGNQADLDEAVAAGRDAVAATAPDDPDRAGYLSNLANALQTRFQRTGNQVDLDEAIEAGRVVVAASPPEHPARATRLSNLGVALATRFTRTRDLADLDEAIGVGREAVAASPPDHHEHATRLSNLGAALRIRFELTRDLADLDEAIGVGREAVAASPPDDPDRAKWLSSLGDALQTRFERIGESADLDEVVTTYREAAAVNVASPHVRVRAAREWGRAAAVGEQWQEAVAGFTAAVDLFGRVAPRSLLRHDQEHLLEELGSLGADAAACCVHAGLTDRAVELFEQGRGVLLGQALDTRTDLTALAEQYLQTASFPVAIRDLAERFTALRDELDRADDGGGRPVASPAMGGGDATDARAGVARLDVERRRKVADAFDWVIAEIRARPGFDGFLRPLPARDLAAAAADGPVVVVNVSRFGSHALILTSGGVLDPVPLEDLTSASVYRHVDEFITALDDAQDATVRLLAERRLVAVLGWLWDVLAGPVLDRLGISGPPPEGEPWPRLWWCVSGLLSFLPVHAAGHHAVPKTVIDTVPKTVIDRVVSSYTPTIRALAHARRTHPQDSGDRGRAGWEGRVVVVAMPHTPGLKDLLGVKDETAWLRQRFADRVTTLVGNEATHEAVLTALPAARWAHFACHGVSVPTNPSASYLALIDHRQQPLTVVDVARLRLDEAELAFLSACSTARPGDRLVDEAIHLASAFQLAGYRHVIGTLWEIYDRVAVALAETVYAALARPGAGTVDAAGALHAAIHQLLGKHRNAPSVWASHIHSGA